MKLSPRLPMQWMNSGRHRMPTFGVSCSAGGGNLGNLVDLVGANADGDRLAIEFDLEHHDAGIDGRRLLLHAELDAQIGQAEQPCRAR